MTLSEFSTWLSGIDPTATRFSQPKATNQCTVWREYQPRPLHADGKAVARVWKVQIERYTPTEDDPIAAAIAEAIENSDCIAASCQIDSDPESGILRYLFECEVLT